MVSQILWAVTNENEGQHVQDVATSGIDVVAKSLLLSEILWSLVATLIRTAALIMVRRVFCPLGSERRRCAMNTLIGLTLLHGVSTLVVSLRICQPIRASWDHSAGHCGNQIEAYILFEVLGLVLDLFLAGLPLYWIFQLQMVIHRKLIPSMVLSVGSLVIIVTGFRIAALDKVDTSDFTYDQAYLGLLSTLGALISVMLGCATAIPMLLRDCLVKRNLKRTIWLPPKEQHPGEKEERNDPGKPETIAHVDV
ncbi:uncharacterized protein PG998_015106 [Apiospora kogelbergensis]|uniref:uncharacterized protein n=1 Tax=Apiospora kogelbergensis TaxID=1337665 RepID=UPI0031315806